MDIIVKTVLDFIQSRDYAKHSVLAGGAVRDHIYDLDARDYDIFVPSSINNTYLINAIKKEFGLDKKHDLRQKGEEYESSNVTVDINGVYNFKFEGKDFDIIFKAYDNDEDFGSTVVDTFDYGVNMVYYNGLYIEDSNKYFEYDRMNYSMTLVRLSHISSLPKAMTRYHNFCEKSKMKLVFRAPCLQVLDENKNQKKEPKKVFYHKEPIPAPQVPRRAGDLEIPRAWID